MRIDSTGLEQVLDLVQLIRFVGSSVAIPAGSYADCIRDCTSISASTHRARLFEFASFLMVNIDDRLYERMIEREVQGRAVASDLEAEATG